MSRRINLFICSDDFVRRSKRSQTYHPRGLFLFIENSNGLESIPWDICLVNVPRKETSWNIFKVFSGIYIDEMTYIFIYDGRISNVRHLAYRWNPSLTALRIVNSIPLFIEKSYFLIIDFSMFYFDALAKFADDKIMTKQIIIMIWIYFCSSFKTNDVLPRAKHDVTISQPVC